MPICTSPSAAAVTIPSPKGGAVAKLITANSTVPSRATEMFSTWPDEAFHGFTIMDKENEALMWTWTMGEGLRRINFMDYPKSKGEEGGILAEMFIEADRDLVVRHILQRQSSQIREAKNESS